MRVEIWRYLQAAALGQLLGMLVVPLMVAVLDMGSSICLDTALTMSRFFWLRSRSRFRFRSNLLLGKRRRQRIELASRHWQTVSHCRLTEQAGDGSLFLIPAPPKGRSRGFLYFLIDNRGPPASMAPATLPPWSPGAL